MKRGAAYRKAQLAVHQRSGRRCESPQAWKDAFGCDLSAVHVHHIRRRVSDRDDVPALLVDLCLRCHAMVHANPAAAYEAGLLVHSWDGAA